MVLLPSTDLASTDLASTDLDTPGAPTRSRCRDTQFPEPDTSNQQLPPQTNKFSPEPTASGEDGLERYRNSRPSKVPDARHVSM
jgi:hypothetical protein